VVYLPIRYIDAVIERIAVTPFFGRKIAGDPVFGIYLAFGFQPFGVFALLPDQVWV
jgi:hypothetical protein